MVASSRSTSHGDSTQNPGRPPRTPQDIPAGGPLRALVEALSAIDRAETLEAGQAGLQTIGESLGLPTLSWAPDVARPDFDRHMDAFMRRAGWSDEVLSLWWNRAIMLKSPLYIRCRTGAEPFVTDLGARIPSRPSEIPRLTGLMRDMGLRALITAPVHLPRGRIAMVTWGGGLTKAEAREALGFARPYLLAAAHLFMRVYLAETARFPSSAEELARLTPREQQCLRLTAQGHREEQVAGMLGLRATTVRFHLDNVVRKLGAANRVHAVALGAQLGLVGPID